MRTYINVCAIIITFPAFPNNPNRTLHHIPEQRVTGLVVSLLVGLSALAGGVLRLVPLSVLFGVFLYMGISALAGIQLWERTILMLKPPKHHPPVI